jgi:hypothetical protein
MKHLPWDGILHWIFNAKGQRMKNKKNQTL